MRLFLMVLIFGIMSCRAVDAPAGDVKTSTVTIFNYSTGSYRSYEVQTEGNVTEVFSYQNANTVRIEQVSPGDFEIFDYGLGRGLDLPEVFLDND